MAQPTNTFDHYDSIGIKEDLEDIIYDISPTDTYFLTNASKMKAKQAYHEWQTDALAAAATNRAIDGDDATGDALTATTRVGNYCQISRAVIVVAGATRAMDAAGRADELSYQTAKAAKELKRDMEYALTQNQASSAGGSSTARSLGSLESWLKTNKTTQASAADSTAATTPGFASGVVAAPTDATGTGTFAEATLKTVIQACWTQGGDPKVILVGPHNKKKASGFTGIATQYRDNQQVGPATIIGAADVYVSDFGTHNIVASRFSRDRTALVLDFEFLGVAYLRPFMQEELAKTGDADKRMMLVDYTLVVKNEAASGKVTDLTTS